MILKIELINKRFVCIGGVGRMFYQNGFPISMAIQELKKKGVEVSIYHVAKECLDQGWKPNRVYSKLSEDFRDDISRSKYDFEDLKKFCFADFNTQSKMIFDYLFNGDLDSAKFFFDMNLIDYINEL